MSQPGTGGSILLQKKSSLCGCRPAVDITKLRRNRTQSCYTISLESEAPVVQHSLCSHLTSNLCCVSACAAAKEREQVRLGPLLIFNYISWGLGESRLSFKISSLFPGSSCGCAGASPYPIPFMHLPGFRALILSDLFFQIFLPIMVPTMHASKFCFIIWLLLCMRQQRNFPLVFIPLLVILGKFWQHVLVDF